MLTWLRHLSTLVVVFSAVFLCGVYQSPLKYAPEEYFNPNTETYEACPKYCYDCRYAVKLMNPARYDRCQTLWHSGKCLITCNCSTTQETHITTTPTATTSSSISVASSEPLQSGPPLDVATADLLAYTATTTSPARDDTTTKDDVSRPALPTDSKCPVAIGILSVLLAALLVAVIVLTALLIRERRINRRRQADLARVEANHDRGGKEVHAALVGDDPLEGCLSRPEQQQLLQQNQQQQQPQHNQPTLTSPGLATCAETERELEPLMELSGLHNDRVLVAADDHVTDDEDVASGV